jgi:hypothetical protein
MPRAERRQAVSAGSGQRRVGCSGSHGKHDDTNKKTPKKWRRFANVLNGVSFDRRDMKSQRCQPYPTTVSISRLHGYINVRPSIATATRGVAETNGHSVERCRAARAGAPLADTRRNAHSEKPSLRRVNRCGVTSALKEEERWQSPAYSSRSRDSCSPL